MKSEPTVEIEKTFDKVSGKWKLEIAVNLYKPGQDHQDDTLEPISYQTFTFDEEPQVQHIDWT